MRDVQTPRYLDALATRRQQLDEGAARLRAAMLGVLERAVRHYLDGEPLFAVSSFGLLGVVVVERDLVLGALEDSRDRQRVVQGGAFYDAEYVAVRVKSPRFSVLYVDIISGLGITGTEESSAKKGREENEKSRAHR